MSSTTANLNLYKANPTTDGENTFNIDTILNDNWDKIDSQVAKKTEIPVIPTSLPANGGNATTVNNHTAAATPVTLEKVDLVGMVNEVDNSLISHKADYVKHPGYAAATGIANTYAVTLNPAPTSYTDGMGIVVKINVASTGASTLNVNGLGAKTILDSLGNAITAGGLKANTPYTMRYNGTFFIVQGKGGGGTATSSDILLGKTATTDIGFITGNATIESLGGSLAVKMYKTYTIASSSSGQTVQFNLGITWIPKLITTFAGNQNGGIVHIATDIDSNGNYTTVRVNNNDNTVNEFRATTITNVNYSNGMLTFTITTSNYGKVLPFNLWLVENI